MADVASSLIVLAGPNGAGKSTVAPSLLRDALEVDEFVNADTIARGLSEFAPERVAMAAGRVMLRRLKELARQRKTFGFETTLASRTFAPWIAELLQEGYCFQLVFLWLPDSDTAVRRVAQRKRSGGHDVPEETVRRRYAAGLRNFFELYRPLATEWRLYDNSGIGEPRLVVKGGGESEGKVYDRELWRRIQERCLGGKRGPEQK